MESQNKQQLAKDLYLQADKTQTEIAEILDVNRKTVYLWSKKGKWEETRIALSQTPSNILQEFYNHMGAVNKKIREREDNCPTMEEVEKLRKLAKMSKDMGKKHPGIYMEVLEEFSHFIQHGDRTFLDKYVKNADQFLKGTFGDEHFYVAQRAKANAAKIRENLKKQEEDAAKEEAALKKEETEELVFDGYKFVPVQKAAGSDAAQTAGCKLPTEKVGNNGASGPLPENPSKPATVNNYSEKQSDSECLISTSKISENGALPVGAVPSGCPPDDTSACPANTKPEPSPSNNNNIITPVRGSSLSLEFTPVKERSSRGEVRPAPFRDGNIIWINHPKDLDDYEKHLKMSDIIRYYPESDPSLRKDR